MRLVTFLVSLSCVFFAHGFTDQCIAQAQRAIGVSWQPPENTQEALGQLDTFQQLDIPYLIVRGQLSEEIWQQLYRHRFKVYAQMPIIFPLVQTFAEPDSSLINIINTSLDQYADHSSVAAVGLYQYGPELDPALASVLRPIIKQAKDRYSGKLYYITTRNENASVDSLFDFNIREVRVGPDQISFENDSVSTKTGAYIYKPGNPINDQLNPFKKFLQNLPRSSVPVFVDSKWLLNMLQAHPGFEATVKSYNSTAEFIFPTPKEQPPGTENHSLIVLLLVFVWGIFAINYHMSPVYRKSLIRYFLGHVFFVEDVMDRHIRSTGHITPILIQNILLAGICFYSLGSVWFSKLGREAVSYHYPFISILPNLLFSAFLWGCILAIVLTLVSIIWIRVTNKAIIDLRQVLNLYAWPLQINFIIATLMATLLMAGNYPGFILLLGLLFAGIHISSFIVTATDTAKYLKRKRLAFLAGSVGVYILIWIGLALWISGSSIPKVIRLAISL